MKTDRHCSPVSRLRFVAPATNYVVKLESTTQIIDRLLLIPRQASWKATGPVGNPDDTTDTDTGTDTDVEV